MKICTFAGCDKELCAKGLCKVHYNMQRAGQPLHVIGTGSKARYANKTKICKFEGCANKHMAKGFCSTHYNQTLRHKMPYKVIARKGIPQKCTFADCDKQGFARGYCSMHYQRWRLNGDADIVRPKGRAKSNVNKVCSVHNCNNAHSAKGYCHKHYERNKKYGHPLGGHIRYTAPKSKYIDKAVQELNYSNFYDSEALRDCLPNYKEDDYEMV